jgi:hypothetical protein
MDRASPHHLRLNLSVLGVAGLMAGVLASDARRQIDDSRCTVAVGRAGIFPIALGVVHATTHLRTMSLRSSWELGGMTRKISRRALVHQSEHSVA